MRRRLEQVVTWKRTDLRIGSTARQPSSHSSNQRIIWLIPRPRWTSNWCRARFGRDRSARRYIGAEDVDRPAAPLLGIFGEQHGQRIDFLAGGAAGRPDPDPPVECRFSRASGARGGQQVERRPVAEEIGFVVQKRLDDLVRKGWLLAHHQDRDQLVEGRDSALAKQRRQRRFDPPAPVHRQLLAGARLEQAGEDPARAVAYLHVPSPVREAIRRAILSGGMTAQASPASMIARGIPQTAELASSWARIDPPHATSRLRAFDPVAAHSGQDDTKRGEPNSDRPTSEHRIDRREAAAGRPSRTSFTTWPP
jgi:hypothetical protein